MQIVVTGAAGFIGSHLCERLASLKHNVVGVDSFSDYYPVWLKERNARELADAGVPIERLDLACDRLEGAIANAELVFHLAAQPGIAAGVPQDAYVRNNLVATHALLEACASCKRRPFLVNVSTSSVYGRRATAEETAEPEPISHYGATKLAAEQLALAYWRKHRLPVCSMRLFSVYGPRERPEKLYMKLISSILQGEEFPLYDGSLHHKRAYTFVDDAVAGLLAVLDHRDRCVGEIFNIGSDIETRTSRGIEIVEEILGQQARLKVLPPRPGDQTHTRANIDKARAILGFAPNTELENGLNTQIAWCKKLLADRRNGILQS